MSPPVYKQFCCSEVSSSHFEYEWTIKNCKLLSQKNGQYIFSPIFSATKKDEVKWRLQLYPRGRDKGVNNVSLFLYLDSQDAANTNVEVHCELSIRQSDVLTWKNSFTFTYDDCFGYGFDDMMATDELLDSDESESITIYCKVDIPQRLITVPGTEASINPVTFDLRKGPEYENFSQLFGDSRFYDVTIVVGGEKFTAHKVVLAMRSAVFAAMFEHKGVEVNRMDVVKVEDLEPAAVKGMLEFIYTDKVTDLKTLARELLKASDKYDLHRLRTMCEEVLYKTITIDNAADILLFSDLHRSHKLKEFVMVFMDDNLLSLVKSESYKGMVKTYPGLLDQFVHSIAARREALG